MYCTLYTYITKLQLDHVIADQADQVTTTTTTTTATTTATTNNNKKKNNKQY